VFVYGGNDPWTAGAFEVNEGRQQARYTVVGAHGNHGANLTRLPPADKEAAIEQLRAWLGLPAQSSGLTDSAPPKFDVDALLEPRRRL
jgi:hypothetical protein